MVVRECYKKKTWVDSDMKTRVPHARRTVYHWRPVIQCNVVQTWGLLTAPLFEFASVCGWFIWVHSLTRFNIYITINITNSFNQTSLPWRYDLLLGAWISVDTMICKRASPVMGFGFGSVPGQTGWQYSKHESQRQNCWEAVEIGTW